MRSLLAFLLVAQTILGVIAGSLPLTSSEIGLMLRSGYSSEAVLRELSTRHFAGDLDSETEQRLARAGANQSLISALRSGAYAAPSAEIEAAQEKLAAREKQSAPAAEQSDRLKTSPPASLSSQSATPVAPPSDTIYQMLAHDLVSLQRGELKPLDDRTIAGKKFYLFFFSASTSAAARKFTPQLVEYYNRVAPLHPEFETIFFTKDRSPFGMETYMRQTNMPWPAVVFDKVASKAPAQASAIDLPLVILVNGSGRILYTASGNDDADASKVTVALDQILTNSSADPHTSSR